MPIGPAKSPNYFCTWFAQNYWVGRTGELKDLNLVTNAAARETINYHRVCGLGKDVPSSMKVIKETLLNLTGRSKLVVQENIPVGTPYCDPNW